MRIHYQQAICQSQLLKNFSLCYMGISQSLNTSCKAVFSSKRYQVHTLIGLSVHFFKHTVYPGNVESTLDTMTLGFSLEFFNLVKYRYSLKQWSKP